MSKTTAPTKPAPTPAQTAADRILGERRQLLESLDQVLLETARKGGQLPPEGYSLARSLGWDRRQTDRELARAGSVIRHQAVAGMSSEREDARRRAEEAERKRDEAAPKLRAAIEKLESELCDLEQKAAEARRESDRREGAVAALRKAVPEHVEQRYLDATRSFRESDIGADLRQAESRLRTINGVLSINGDDERARRQAIQHAASAGRPELIDVKEERNVRTETLNEEQWKTYVAELTEERKTLVADLERLRRMRDEAIAEAEKLLDCYAQ